MSITFDPATGYRLDPKFMAAVRETGRAKLLDAIDDMSVALARMDEACRDLAYCEDDIVHEINCIPHAENLDDTVAALRRIVGV